MKTRSSLNLLSLSLCLLAAPACGSESDGGTAESTSTGTTDPTETEGTTDPSSTEATTDVTTTGDGDGDSSTTTGDGDGDTTSTTDPSTTGDGDGDGDSTTGDGDGDNPNAGVVNCGDEVCDLDTEVCCQGLSGATCKAPGTCGPLEAQVACDGPEDCDGMQRCCAGFPQGSSCADTCADGEADVCHTDADCPTTDCLTCEVPGSTQNMCAEACP